MKRTLNIMTIALFAMVCLATAAEAGIKERMKERLPAIKALKDKGIVGEDNKGYLGFVGEKREKEALVKAENADRKDVYTMIAKTQGVSAEKVGKRRATQLAKLAVKGHWIQSPKGDWEQKQ